MDRNTKTVALEDPESDLSLSARRAWIEMVIGPLIFNVQPVALRKESVDRNAEDWLDAGSLSRRSPQGERG